MGKLRLIAVTLIGLAGTLPAGAAEYDILQPVRVEGSYAVFQGTAEVQGNAFSVGGSTLAVQYGNVGIGTGNPGAALDIARAGGNDFVGLRVFNTQNWADQLTTLQLGYSQFANSGLKSKLYTGGTETDLSFWTTAGGSQVQRMVLLPDGSLGVRSAAPNAALDVVSTGTLHAQMAQIWRDSGGVIKGSMSAAGYLQAVKFIGDGSGLTGLSGDDLGDHNADMRLNMGANPITGTGSVTMSSYTATGIGLQAAQVRFSAANGVVVSSEASAALGGGVRVSTNVYIVGFASATRVYAANFYGNGSGLTGIAGDNLGNHTATQDLNLVQNDILNVASVTLVGKGLQIGTDTTAAANGVFISSYGAITTIGAGHPGSVAPSARGVAAVDLQTRRSTAGQAATAAYSVISGGADNTASNTAAAVSGGYGNSAAGSYSTAGGGLTNRAQANFSAVAGGMSNSAQGIYSAVSGGALNVASGYASLVPGGYQNTSTGQYSFAAGFLSSSTADGAFTWADSGASEVRNNYADRTVFKNRGGFMVTPLTGLLADNLGMVDVVSTATAAGVMAQVWRNNSAVVVGSMSSTGVMTASRFIGDGSGLTGLSGLADDLGNHTAEQNLNMAGYQIVNVSTLTVSSITTTAAAVAFSTNAAVLGNLGVGVPLAQYRLHVGGGDIRNENGLRTGNIADPGRWRFYDISGYLMSFWVPGTDFDTWGLYWDTTNNKVIWRGNGVDATSVDLDTGEGYYAGKLGVGGQPGAQLEVIGGSVSIRGLATQSHVLQAGMNGLVISTGGAITTTGIGHGTVAGNARGIGAVDLQTARTAAASVSSGTYSAIGGGTNNAAGGANATVAGGSGNSAGGPNAFVGGGSGNTASGGQGPVVAGGANNVASGAFSPAVGGGVQNTASGNYSAVAGGAVNQASGAYSAVAGGYYNVAGGDRSAVPGGQANKAQGQYSFAAGYASTSTANGAFTWTDSQGAGLDNVVADRTLFKNRGGFLVTGSTATAPMGALNRGVFITGNGLVGVSTGTPYAALDVVSTGTAQTQFAQVWRGSNGVVVGSMSATGVFQAVKLVGDGSGITGLGGGDNLGDHTATQNLNLAYNNLVNVSSVNFRSNVYLSTAAAAQGGGVHVSTSLYVAGSLNVGSGNSASPVAALAAGRNGAASGYDAIAGGFTNTASGAQSVALGQNNSATGTGSVALGRLNQSAGTGSMAFGNTNSATGSGAAVSGGDVNSAAGNYSAVPGGNSNAAAGTYSLAAGYASSSTAQGAFTWSDSQGVTNANTVADRTVFKNRGGFLVTGSTATAPMGTINRGVFISGNGLIGVSTGAPAAALDAVATGTGDTVYTQIWRDSGGVIRASMTASGKLYADITAASGGGDNLGSHSATQDLDMNNFQIFDVSTLTVKGNAFSVGGSTLAVAAGKVGIGTVNPQASLHVVSSVTINGQLVRLDKGTGNPIVRISDLNDAGLVEIGYSGLGSGRAVVNGGSSGVGASISVHNSAGTQTALVNSNGASFFNGGPLGAGTNNPTLASLEAVSTGTTAGQMAQVWRDSGGVVKGSMSATGFLQAVKFIGDGSGLTGMSTNDPTKVLKAGDTMTGQLTLSGSSLTVTSALGIEAEKLRFNPNIELSSHTVSGYGLGLSVSTLTFTPGLIITSYGELQTTGAGRGSIAGSARGVGAVDLQVNRGAAGRVASGNYAAIGGGQDNTAAGQYAVVPGGSQNTAGNNYSTVGGGLGNNASGVSSMIPGGDNNAASGATSFAAGNRASSGADGAFTWADSQSVVVSNTVADRTVFKNRGGFLVTGSTATAPMGALNRGVFIAANGTIGVSTGVPAGAIDVLATGNTHAQYAQIWRASNGTIVSSMNAAGYLRAVKFIGDGSSITGVAGDNLGNHTATNRLNMGNYALDAVSSATISGSGVTGANPVFKVYGSTFNILANGSVGVGTASPAYRFVVADGYLNTGLANTNNAVSIAGGGASPSAGQVVWGDNTGWKLNMGTRSGGVFVPRITVVDTGNVGISTQNPAGRLDIQAVPGATHADMNTLWRRGDGVIVASMSAMGYLQAVKFIGDGSGLSGVGVNKYLTAALPTTVGNYIELGNYTITNGAHNLYVAVTVADSGFSLAKQYMVPVYYNFTSAGWRDALPIANTGAYSGNDFALEVNSNNGVVYLRLRRTAGATAGTALVNIEQIGGTAAVFAQTSGTGASAINAPLASTPLTQVGGSVGISTASPQARLDIVGPGNTHADMAQIWRAANGTIVSSMNAVGYLRAAKFIGDGSGLTGVGDNLGNHAATNNLNMSSYGIYNATYVIVNAGSLPGVAGSSRTIASFESAVTNSDKLMVISSRTANGTDWNTSGLVIKRRVDVTDMGYLRFGSFSADPVTFGNQNTELMRIRNTGSVVMGPPTNTIEMDSSVAGKVIMKVNGVAVAEMLPN